MVSPQYNISGPQNIPHGRNQHYSGVNSHDAEVLRSRAISPEVAASRGYRTVSTVEADEYGFRNAGLLIPSPNTQGEIERYQLRPHTAPIDRETGKPRKYLWPTGSRQSLDVPPASLDLLPALDVPIIITESGPKADAIVSALIAAGVGQYCVIAVAGVYGWRSNGMPLSDFGDIVWRHKERDRITARRPVYIAFDSDALTNANVTRARWELSQFLRRKGARVLYLDVPAAADGGKQGIDDALAAGHTLSAMIASAYPAPDIMPALTLDAETDTDAPEIERLRTANARLRRQVSVQAQIIKTPYLKDKEKAVSFALIVGAAEKKARGDVGADGRPRMSASEIAHDYRARPEKGEPLPAANNDGTLPITKRSNIKPVILKLREAGILPVTLEPTTRKHATGDTYVDTDFVPEIEDPLEALAKLANYRGKKERKPYTRQEPCPHCKQIHPRKVITTTKTYCEGCGAQTGEDETTTRVIPIPIANDPEITDEQRRDLDGRTTVTDARGEIIDPETGEVMHEDSGSTKNVEANPTVNTSPSPPPSNYSSTFFVEAEPESVADEPPQPASTKNVVSGSVASLWQPTVSNQCTTADCTNQIPPHRKYLCDECGERLEVPA